MLRRDLLVLGFVGFVTSFGAHAVAVNLPAYAETVGVGTLAIGLLIAVYDFAEVIAKPVFGYLADKRGQVVTLWTGLGVFALASFAFLIVDPRWLLAIRLLQGLGAAAFSVVSVALVAAYFPQTRGQALGVYNALKGAGYIVAPAVGGFVVAQSNLAGLFAVSGIIGIVVLILALGLREPVKPVELDADDDFDWREFLASFANPHLLPWYGIIVVNMFFVGILFGFVPVYLNHLGYDAFAAGVILSVGTLAYLIVQPPAGWLADKVGGRATIIAGLLASSASIALIPFTRDAPLIGLVILGGLGIGVVWTNCDVMITQIASGGKLATSLGTAGSYKELGDMLGPLTIGGIAEFFGLAVGFISCGLLGFASTLWLAVWRETRRTRDA